MMDLKQTLEHLADESNPVGPEALVDRIERQLRGDPTTGLVVPPARRLPAWGYAAAAFLVAVGVGALTFLLMRGDDPDVAAPPTAAPQAADRWGLEQADLPDDLAHIAAVFEAMPDSMAGLPGGPSGGEHLVSYGTEGVEGSSLTMQGPEHRIGPSGATMTPEESLALMATAPELDVLGSNLEGPVVWLHVATIPFEAGDPSEYTLVAAERGAEYQFTFTAGSPDDLDAIVGAFLARTATVPPPQPGGVAPAGTEETTLPEEPAPPPETTLPEGTATTAPAGSELEQRHRDLLVALADAEAAVVAFELPEGVEPQDIEACLEMPETCEPGTPAEELSLLGRDAMRIRVDLNALVDEIVASGITYPFDCSGDRVGGGLNEQPGLDPVVAAARADLFEAARTCDWATIERFLGPEDTAECRRAALFPDDATMHSLAEMLRLPPGTTEDGAVVWPNAALLSSWWDIPADERALLVRLFTEQGWEDDEEMLAEAFSWGFPAAVAGLTAEGEWYGARLCGEFG